MSSSDTVLERNLAIAFRANQNSFSRLRLVLWPPMTAKRLTMLVGKVAIALRCHHRGFGQLIPVIPASCSLFVLMESISDIRPEPIHAERAQPAEQPSFVVSKECIDVIIELSGDDPRAAIRILLTQLDALKLIANRAASQGYMRAPPASRR